MSVFNKINPDCILEIEHIKEQLEKNLVNEFKIDSYTNDEIILRKTSTLGPARFVNLELFSKLPKYGLKKLRFVANGTFWFLFLSNKRNYRGITIEADVPIHIILNNEEECINNLNFRSPVILFKQNNHIQINSVLFKKSNIECDVFESCIDHANYHVEKSKIHCKELHFHVHSKYSIKCMEIADELKSDEVKNIKTPVKELLELDIDFEDSVRLEYLGMRCQFDKTEQKKETKIEKRIKMKNGWWFREII